MSASPTKPLASLSLDLDNQWSYMKTHGDPGWESYPSYLDTVVPHILRFLKDRELTITFFIVGQDAALEKNAAALADIAAAGHEIGNHSFKHDPWLHLFAEEDIEAEIAQAETCLQQVTGVRPMGFRGPGYSLSRATLRVLQRRGYRYDASTLPTFLGPLARWYYFTTAKLTPEERAARKRLFGTFREGLRPLRPYAWRLETGSVVELPVTTMPFLKLPFHVSYLLYLGTYSHAVAKLYFRTALTLCRLTRVQPSLLLHPLDFLGGDECDALAFFPAMGMPGEEKRRRVAEFIDLYRRWFAVLPLGAHVDALQAGAPLTERVPRFDTAPVVEGQSVAESPAVHGPSTP